ncbi:MAG: inorganic diphosphatase [Oscillospiraceae bacterium]|nr:inorganic diphosphatase [Oscillospiraceae bacterium]
MNLWHDIDKERVTPDDFLAVIEISKGSKTKYELDKKSGALILDRILYTSTHYPANYGFLPKTLADDGDPLDVLVLSNEVLVPLVLVQCYPIGVINMMDNGRMDQKIIAVPFEEPSYNSYRSIEGLPSHIFDEMIHFFTVYKQLEGKQTAVDEVMGRKAAVDIIRESIANYDEIYGAKYNKTPELAVEEK